MKKVPEIHNWCKKKKYHSSQEKKISTLNDPWRVDVPLNKKTFGFSLHFRFSCFISILWFLFSSFFTFFFLFLIFSFLFCAFPSVASADFFLISFNLFSSSIFLSFFFSFLFTLFPSLLSRSSFASLLLPIIYLFACLFPIFVFFSDENNPETFIYFPLTRWFTSGYKSSEKMEGFIFLKEFLR